MPRSIHDEVELDIELMITAKQMELADRARIQTGYSLAKDLFSSMGQKDMFKAEAAGWFEQILDAQGKAFEGKAESGWSDMRSSFSEAVQNAANHRMYGTSLDTPSSLCASVAITDLIVRSLRNLS